MAGVRGAMMGQRGFTVFELMMALSLFGVLCTTMMSIERRVYQSEKVVRSYVGDLAECRRALRHLEQDLRGASRVEAIASGVRVHTGTRSTDYTLADGVLQRSEGGRVRTVGRRIAAFKAVQYGRRVDIRVVLQPRSKTPSLREAAIHTSVFLRGAGR